MCWFSFIIGSLVSFLLMILINFLIAKRIRRDADSWALVAGRYRRELEKVYNVLMLAEQKQDSISEVEYIEGEEHE